MNNELVFVLELDVGRVTIEISKSPMAAVSELANDLSGTVIVNCAKPTEKIRHLPVIQTQFTLNERSDLNESSIWLYRLYHNSVVDGPGRRSVVQVAGCSIRCPGCYVPETHNRGNGRLVSISSIVEELILSRDENDGVTILGGEPFDQAGSVAELVSRLKRYNFDVVVYTGHTIEKLLAKNDSRINYILTRIDLLIDGPFEKSLASGAGEYRGSSNQRLHQRG